MTCERRKVLMLSDFMSSAKYADVNRAAEDRNEWRLVNSNGYTVSGLRIIAE